MSMFDFTKVYMESQFFRYAPYGIRKKIAEKRLRDIVEFARTNTEYYGRIVPEGWKDMSQIPLTTKKDMLENFNGTLSDKAVTWDLVQKQISEHPESGKILDKYIIATTSGSTGNPAVTIQDTNMMDRDCVNGAGHFIMPIATLVVDSGYGVDSERINRSTGTSGYVSKRVRNFISKQNPEELSRQLNEFQPKTISGYASVIDILADEADRGVLKIAPKRVFLSGEFVSNAARARVSRAFPTAEVRSFYGCTEGGSMAHECKCGHLHVNEDLVLIEPLDADGNVLPYDTLADKIALTNLSNRVQPLIRYVVEDRMTLHRDCPCGRKGTWIEVEGRTYSLLVFQNDQGESVKVSPLNMMDCLDTVSYEGLQGFKRYQLVLHPDNVLECRLDFYDGVDRNDVFAKTKKACLDYLTGLGVKADMYLSDLTPQKTNRRGKVDLIITAKD